MNSQTEIWTDAFELPVIPSCSGCGDISDHEPVLAKMHIIKSTFQSSPSQPSYDRTLALLSQGRFKGFNRTGAKFR